VLGEIRVGRQLTIMGEATGYFDSNSGYMDPLVFNGGYAAGGFTAESRWDNSLKYTLKLNDFVRFQLMARLGSTANGMRTQSAEAGALHLTFGPFKLTGAYMGDEDAELASGSTQLAAGSVPSNPTYTNTLKVTFGNTHAGALFAAYVPDNSPWSAKFGAEQIHTGNPDASHAAYDASITSLSGVAVTQVSTNGFTNARIENMFWATGSYKFLDTWRTNFGFYQRNTNRYGANATAATMAATSSVKYEVLEVIDSLSKRTDVYFNATNSSVSGPVWAGYANPTTSFALGMRHVF